MSALVGSKWRWWIIALLCSWLLIGVIREARGAPLFGDIDALAGTFQQALFNEEGELIASSSGTFAILRPHFFRWHIERPGEQLLVGDGSFFWQYDLDLDTVIRRPLKEQMESPLALLLADDEALSSHYDVVRDGSEVALRPRADNPLFQSVTITLDDELPRMLTLIDPLNQRIELRVVLEGTAGLSPADFSFLPPSEAELTIVNP